MLIHHITHTHVDKIEAAFAYLTPQGWVTPEWVLMLRRTVRPPLNKPSAPLVDGSLIHSIPVGETQPRCP
jgi:hypothetical protein